MVAIKGWCFGLLGLGVCAAACGDDDGQTKVVVVHEGEAGAAAENFPPALGPDDCVSAVTDVELSQPDAAAVWGGITVLEFQAEGGKLRNFEAQVFDPDTEVWINQYLPTQFSGQRDDGTYVLGVSVSPSENSKDGDFKLRVRPVQSGCPEAEWVESDTFTLASPIEGTTWHGSIPGDHFDSRLLIDSVEGFLDVTINSAELDLSFGDDGAFSQTFSLDLSTADNGPYDGCTLAFTFEGSWRHELASYSGGTVFVSRLGLASTEGTTCKGGPDLSAMLISDPEVAATFELGQSSHYLNVDYLPTLSTTPGAPRWQTNLGRDMLSLLPAMLGYEVPALGEGGSNGARNAYGDGFVNVNDLEVEKQ